MAEGPADIDKAGGFNFGVPGAVHQVRLDKTYDAYSTTYCWWQS